MTPEPPGGSTPPAPRPAGQRVAAAVTIVALVIGYPLGIVIYSTAGQDTRNLVGALLAVMTGGVVAAWFLTRPRRPADDDGR